jgi:histone H3/H4
MNPEKTVFVQQPARARLYRSVLQQQGRASEDARQAVIELAATFAVSLSAKRPN